MMERSHLHDLGKVTFDKQVNVLEKYCKGDISYTFTKP